MNLGLYHYTRLNSENTFITSNVKMRYMFVLLAVLLVVFNVVHGDTVYVISPNNRISSCQPVSKCFTLSQFAANSNSYLKQNTTLILQPGNHTLNSVLLVSNVMKFSMITGTANIACTPSGKLRLQMVQYAIIENVLFTHCVDNVISNVEYLTLSRLVFLGPSIRVSGTGVHINNASVTIHQCSFSFYLYGSNQNTSSHLRYGYAVREMTAWAGGAIIARRSNIVINQSAFKENRAQFGGAIYTVESNVVITNSVFDFNTANSSHSTTVAGGSAIFAANSVIFINNTELIKNHVYYGYSLGGALAIISSKLTITNSLVKDNRAYDSGGGLHAISSNITMINCTCLENRADTGGLLFVNRSSLMILNAYIGNNRASINGGAVVSFSSIVTMRFTLVKGTYAKLGGVVYSDSSAITMQKSMLAGNLAMIDGGVVYCRKNCNIQANESSFTSNAVEQNGGVVSVDKDCYVTAMRCEFFNNSASSGAVFCSSNSFISITKSAFRNNFAYTEGGAISVFNSMLYISTTSFAGNGALVGGVLKVKNSSLFLHTLLISNNSATRGGVMEIVTSKLTLTNISIISNFGRKGIISIQWSHVVFMNRTAVIDNKGSFVAVNSTVKFLGFTLFKNNHQPTAMFPSSTDRYYGGALTFINSSLSLGGGYAIFINNSAINGGAIHANMSKVTSTGRLLAFRNSAKASGGAMYFENSKLQCNGTMQFYGNVAVERGGGVESVNSSMSLNFNCSLLFDKNWAPVGNDIVVDTL